MRRGWPNLADVQALIAVVDRVMFSVRAGQTRLSDIETLADAVFRQGQRKMRFVLNDATGRRARAYQYG